MGDEFVSLEDLTEDHWKQIEELSAQVLNTGVFDKNQTRSAVAAFILWLSDHAIGISIPDDGPKKKNRSTSRRGVH